jgi:hypothetical protein
MVSTASKNPLKALQTEVARGVPLGVEALAAVGVSSALASHYVKGGWLVRLGRGVFAFPSDQLQRDGCLKFLESRFAALHVGGKTALAWRGIRHNLASQEQLILWGEQPSPLPDWFTQRFPARYMARHLFDESLPPGFGLQTLPETPDGPLVSVPERALLEMLSEVGLSQSVEEARNLMEGLRHLRVETLATLLGSCQRVKVTRLCVQWAEELEMSWALAARQAARHLGSPGRWSGRMKDGTSLVLKR